MKKIVFLILLLTTGFFIQNTYSQCNWSKLGVSEGLLDTSCNSVANTNGYIIVGTGYSASKNGVSVYDGTSWTTYEDDSLSGEVYSAIVDQNGAYWYGSFNGLHKWDGSTRKIYHQSDGLLSENISSVFEDNDGNIWVAHSGTGVSVFDGSTWKTFTDTNDLCDLFIVGFKTAPDGKVYAGSYNGCLSIFDGLTPVGKMYPNLNEMADFTFDNEGNLWMLDYSFGPIQGSQLLKWDGSKYTRYDDLSAIGGMVYIQKMEADPFGNIWVSVYPGLAKFDGTNWTKYDKASGLPGDNVAELTIDNDGTVWAATPHGLGKYTQTNRLEGRIFYNTTAIKDAYAKLYKESDGVKQFVQIDSVQVDGNFFFTFNDVPLGKYIILGVADVNTYTDAVPTYFGDNDFWGGATQIKVSSCDSLYPEFEITVLKKEPVTPGNGVISGTIKSLDGTRAGTNPIKDVDVTLKKASGSLVDNTKTDHTGFYKFEGLSSGDYEIWVDIPGLGLDTVRKVTVTESDTVHPNQDFGVDSNGIHVDDFSSIKDFSLFKNVRIYPNPASKNLFINIDENVDDNLKLNIYDISGKEVLSNTYDYNTDKIQINIEDLNKGIYFIHLNTSDKLLITKIIIE